MRAMNMKLPRIHNPEQQADRHTPPERLRPVVVPRPAPRLLPTITVTVRIGMGMLVWMVVTVRVRGVGDHKHWE